MGGGGSSGSVSWPSELRHMHCRFLIGSAAESQYGPITGMWRGLGTRFVGQSPFHLAQAMEDVIKLNPFRLSDMVLELPFTLRDGTAAGATSTSITLDSGAVTTLDYYVGCNVQITGGRGVGQVRLITAYSGATRIATVDQAWTTLPDTTSTFSVYALNEIAVPGNPNAQAYNPTPQTTDMIAALRILNTEVNALSPVQDFGNLFTSAMGHADLLYPTSPTADSTIEGQVTKAIENAKSLIDHASANTIDLDLTVDWALSKVKNNLSPYLKTMPGEFEATFRPIIQRSMESARQELTPTAARVLSIGKKEFLPLMLECAGKASVLNQVLDDTVDRVSNRIRLLPGEAVKIALNAIPDEVISPVVVTYEREQRRVLNQNIGRYAASMAQAGALLGTAYANGLALMLDDHAAKVAQFRAQLTMESFRDLLRQYLERHAQESSQENQLKVQVMGLFLESLSSQIAEQLRLYGRLLSDQGEMLLRTVSEQYRWHAEQLVQLMNKKAGAQTDAVSNARSMVGYHVQMLAERNKAVSSWVSYMNQMVNEKLQHRVQSTHYTGEVNRMIIAAHAQEQETNLEIDTREVQFPLDMYDYAARMLAAISGGVTQPQTKSPNKAASVLGGAISGVAAGAEVGKALGLKAGGPMGWAVGIGAALGGALGLFE
ncbi:MAG TPA: hypothetical protein VLH56_08570 [Dissulfurispiraceae bacterium]|nr:hypothetical protein [Dissulfurispiraceae bacterium]